MSKGHTLQDPYLNVLRKERVPVSIYLVNGIKLQGQIESFDQFVVLLFRPSYLHVLFVCQCQIKTAKSKAKLLRLVIAV